MRACAIAVLLVLAGCDEERALEEDTAAEEESSSDDGIGETFSEEDSGEEGSTTDDGGPAQLHEYCGADTDCEGGVPFCEAPILAGCGFEGISCIANTCTQWIAEPRALGEWEETGASPCPAGDVPVLGGPGDDGSPFITCAVKANVMDDLAYCGDDDMHAVAWVQPPDALPRPWNFDAYTCWHAELRSGQECSDDGIEQTCHNGAALPRLCP